MEYIIDTFRLVHNFNKLKQYGLVYYPLKTNDTKPVVKCIGELCNNRFLISNINQAKRLNTENKYSTVINTLISLEELINLYKLGIRCYVFDNFDKMQEFLSYVHDKYIEITVKLSLTQLSDIAVNTGANKEEQNKMIEYLVNNNYKYGYSIYLNKLAKKIVDKQNIINIIQRNMKDKHCQFMSLGGIENIDNKSYADYLKGIQEIVKSHNKEFRIEPGEQLVGNAVDGIAKILAIHSNKNSLSITIDGSTYKEFYDAIAFGKVYDFCIIKNNKDGEIIQIYKHRLPDTIKVHIFGNSSDSNDYIGEYYIESGKSINIGDIIKIKNIGAYFNRENLF